MGRATGPTLDALDAVRLDHFIGFHRYWEIPAWAATAQEGRFVAVPGRELFAKLQSALGGLPFIAEDLGLVTEEVHALRSDFHMPGMRVLEFAFGGGFRDYQPHRFPRECVVYTGTHDNDTLVGWLTGYERASDSAERSRLQEERARALSYAGSDGTDAHWAFIRLAQASVANTAIFPVQDLLGQGSEARMNVPGTASGNWTYRYRAEELTPAVSDRLLSSRKRTSESPRISRAAERRPAPARPPLNGRKPAGRPPARPDSRASRSERSASLPASCSGSATLTDSLSRRFSLGSSASRELSQPRSGAPARSGSGAAHASAHRAAARCRYLGRQSCRAGARKPRASAGTGRQRAGQSKPPPPAERPAASVPVGATMARFATNWKRWRCGVNTRTSTRVILRYIRFKAGDVLDVDDPEVELTRFRLLGTGFFRDVQFSLRKGSERGLVVLVVEVAERNTIVVNDVSMGLSAEADNQGNARHLSAYGGLDVAETNLGGTGITLGAAAAVAEGQGALRVRFLDPAFLGGPWMTSGLLLFNSARDVAVNGESFWKIR